MTNTAFSTILGLAVADALGEDTDTTAAVAGGLAGLFYGLGGIPDEWLDTLLRRDFIEDITERMVRALY